MYTIEDWGSQSAPWLCLWPDAALEMEQWMAPAAAIERRLAFSRDEMWPGHRRYPAVAARPALHNELLIEKESSGLANIEVVFIWLGALLFLTPVSCPRRSSGANKSHDDRKGKCIK